MARKEFRWRQTRRLQRWHNTRPPWVCGFCSFCCFFDQQPATFATAMFLVRRPDLLLGAQDAIPIRLPDFSRHSANGTNPRLRALPGNMEAQIPRTKRCWELLHRSDSQNPSTRQVPWRPTAKARWTTLRLVFLEAKAHVTQDSETKLHRGKTISGGFEPACACFCLKHVRSAATRS